VIGQFKQKKKQQQQQKQLMYKAAVLRKIVGELRTEIMNI